jgi:hypothetical protein
MIRRTLSKNILEKDNFQLWNSFIDILAMENEKNLTDIQKNAQRAFWYESEVQNGGHVQYFENMNLDNYVLIINSLKYIGADNHAEILEKAVKIYFKNGIRNIDSVNDLIKASLEDKIQELDYEYNEIKPNMNYYLKEYLNKYLEEFIEME